MLTPRQGATVDAPRVGLRRVRARVRGIVQGVGFRPFVFNLAGSLGLSGHVLNNSEGVTIEAEGEPQRVGEFLSRLRTSAPPLAKVQGVEVEELGPSFEAGFTIRESVAAQGRFALISPDAATCEDCWRDFSDPTNRRFGYPFTNCTHCGPRYSIIQDIPYDRPNTTMSLFAMCGACEAEYHDPADRRFHAQPNACADCGPTLLLADGSLRPPDATAFAASGREAQHIAAKARALLRAGKILAVRGVGGFHLTCDATNSAAVSTLRSRKRRSEKPFAVMARNLHQARQIAEVGDAEGALLQEVRRPIVILRRRTGSAVSPEVAPGNDTIGVMLPYTPLHDLLFGAPGGATEFQALVLTSGNLSEEPIACDILDAWERLGGIADHFLLHNREIYMRTDDSVARVLANEPRVLRRSRGYAPYPIDLGTELAEVLAVGAELKNTFCLTKGKHAILSQHIGDMENYETLAFFEKTLANLRKLFRVTPQAVAHDMHPGYLSTRMAANFPELPKIAVQHHHAHVASCMAENGVTGEVIGVAFDGTGYGTDGQVWGGEFLVADLAGFERRAHFRYVPLAGGDAAVRQTWRPALAHLGDALGERALAFDLPLFEQVPAAHLRVVRQMLSAGVNTVQTSSCGRLFDAVAAITGLRLASNYEGQAAIELEAAIDHSWGGSYEFLLHQGSLMQLDFRPTIEAIAREVCNRVPLGRIAAGFHNTIVRSIVVTCEQIAREEGFKRVCLTGGTFQNAYLLKKTLGGLTRAGLTVLTHRQVPPNDGGISLGQAVIAAQQLRTVA